MPSRVWMCLSAQQGLRLAEPAQALPAGVATCRELLSRHVARRLRIALRRYQVPGVGRQGPEPPPPIPVTRYPIPMWAWHRARFASAICPIYEAKATGTAPVAGRIASYIVHVAAAATSPAAARAAHRRRHIAARSVTHSQASGHGDPRRLSAQPHQSPASYAEPQRTTAHPQQPQRASAGRCAHNYEA